MKSVKLIHDNLKFIKACENCNCSIRIIREDALKFIKNSSDRIWDIIFIDPPYKIDEKIMTDIFEILSSGIIINQSSVIVYEYFFKRDVSYEIKSMKVLKKSYFGDKIVSYISLL